MKNALRVKKAGYLLAAVLLVAGFLPITSIQVVFADDGTQPVPEAVEPAPEAPSQPAVSPQPETATADEAVEVVTDAPVAAGEIVNDEVVTDDETISAGDEEIPPADLQPDEETDEASGGIDELVALISEEGVAIADESGEPLELASENAVEALSSQDPFFWNGTYWVGYTKTGTGCPTNVLCLQDNFPVQKAVSMAGSGNTVYFAGGSYDEDVVLNTPDLSFVGFQNVTVLNQFNPGITVDNTGFALIKSLTLNVNFNVTNGVYATTIIVNGPNGRLNDGLALVNTGGTVEADIVLQSGGGYYVIKDVHDPASPEYEWECAEPDVLIYQKGTSQNPSGEYRMVFMPPSDDDIINYYSNSPDERTDRNPPPNLVGTPLSALERLEDLMVGVNVSQQAIPLWSHPDERLIYWNLLGNMGIDANGQPMGLNGGQQSKADSITNGSNDGIARTWGIWFLWPKIEDPNNKNGKGPLPVSAFQTATEKPRQLTFINTPVRQVTGCTNPAAMNYDPNATIDNRNCHFAVFGCTNSAAINYDPNANTDDGSCAYRATPAPQPAPPGNTIGFIPVTGAGGGPVEDLILIPVTGVDLAEQRMLKINELVFLAGFALLSSGLIMRMGKKRDQA